MTRRAIADTFDAVVDLGPWGELASYAYVIAKFTYRIERGACVRDAADPLEGDLRDDAIPRIPVRTDFGVHKRATDVIVEGSAFAKQGKPIKRCDIRCRVGEREKSIAVFGRRFIECNSAGRPTIGAADAFTEVPVTNDRAYGGVDSRVFVPEPESILDVLRLATDHPGAYPRNPFGKGYCVAKDRAFGIELPNLEDPGDLLTDVRLIVGDPKHWYRQPLPWSFERMHPMMFPRCASLGAEPWYPAPNCGELADVRARGAPFAKLGDPSWRDYYQDASLGMTFQPLGVGCPITIAGMHPEEDVVSLSLPAPPSIQIEVDGDREPVAPFLTSVAIRPAEKRVSLVYTARTGELPRALIPGIHPSIPVAAHVDGTAVAYADRGTRAHFSAYNGARTERRTAT